MVLQHFEKQWKPWFIWQCHQNYPGLLSLCLTQEMRNQAPWEMGIIPHPSPALCESIYCFCFQVWPPVISGCQLRQPCLWLSLALPDQLICLNWISDPGHTPLKKQYSNLYTWQSGVAQQSQSRSFSSLTMQ